MAPKPPNDSFSASAVFRSGSHWESVLVVSSAPWTCVPHTRVCVLSPFSPVQLYATLWTGARQAPLFMGFSRQECWSGLPCCLPETLPGSGIEPESLMSSASAGGFFTTWEAPLGKPLCTCTTLLIIVTLYHYLPGKVHLLHFSQNFLKYSRIRTVLVGEVIIQHDYKSIISTIEKWDNSDFKK